MITEVIKVPSHEGHRPPAKGSQTSDRVCTDTVRRCCEILSDGGLVAFPTETVYGLAARADSPEAIARLREVKSRGPDKAFTIHIASSDDVSQYVPDLKGSTNRLIRNAWPGPLTIIARVDDPSSVPAMSWLNESAASVMYFQNTIGLRCPDNDLARELLKTVEAPIVAASANRAGQPAPITGDDVLKELDGQIDLLIDAGRTKYAKPSTIVRVTESSYEMIREGVYDAGIIERLSMVRILFVCTGNTCRSPMAEVLAKKLLAERIGCDISDLEATGVWISSAGAFGGFGGATQQAINVMARKNLDLTRHDSTVLSADLIRQADYIFPMTRSHYDRIIELVPDAADRVTLLLDNDLIDPIGGAEDAYESCAASIVKGLHTRLKEVVV